MQAYISSAMASDVKIKGRMVIILKLTCRKSRSCIRVAELIECLFQKDSGITDSHHKSTVLNLDDAGNALRQTSRNTPKGFNNMQLEGTNY
jgi:hypothetical protein